MADKEKKTDMIGVMVTPTVRQFVEGLAETEDRSKSYIAGMLLTRGIAAYKKDGKLKEGGRSKKVPTNRAVTETTNRDESKNTKRG